MLRLPFLLLLGMNFIAQHAAAIDLLAESACIEFGFTLSQSKSVYRGTPHMLGKYSQISHTLKQHVFIEEENPDIENAPVQTIAVPGLQCEGHSLLLLNFGSDQNNMHVDLLRLETTSESRMNYSAHLTFIEGDAEVFKEGGFVKLEVMKNSMQEVEKEYFTMAENALENVTKDLLGSLVDEELQSPPSIFINSLTQEGGIRLQGTKDEMTLFTPNVCCKASLQLF